MQSGNQVQGLLDTAQFSTVEITEGYYWLDGNGRMVTYSEVDTGKFPDYRGNDLSFRDYFQVPARDHVAYASTVALSVDDVSRMYVLQPILDSQGDFRGVVVAAIRTNNLATLLDDEISKEINNTVTVIDEDGIIMKGRLPGLTGQSVFSPRDPITGLWERT